MTACCKLQRAAPPPPTTTNCRSHLSRGRESPWVSPRSAHSQLNVGAPTTVTAAVVMVVVVEGAGMRLCDARMECTNSHSRDCKVWKVWTRTCSAFFPSPLSSLHASSMHTSHFSELCVDASNSCLCSQSCSHSTLRHIHAHTLLSLTRFCRLCPFAT